MQSSSLRHGKQVSITEVLDPNSKEAGLNDSVRVTGKLSSYDAASNLASVTQDGKTLLIDTSLLGQFSFQIGSLFQFIGEIAQYQGQNNISSLIVRARVCRNVDGLDMALYEQALQLQREFLKDPNYFTPP